MTIKEQFISTKGTLQIKIAKRERDKPHWWQ